MIKYVTREEAMNNPNLIVPIASDDIFHEVFGKQENVSNTEALISAFLDIPLEELKGRVEIKSRDMNHLTVNSKHGEKDIVVWISKDEPLKLTIEMNRYSVSDSTIERNFFFATDVFSSGLKAGLGYTNLTKTIQLNFNPKYVDTNNNPIIDKYTLKNDFKHELTNKFILYQINIAELSKVWYNESNQDVSNINSLSILFGALILENEKDKFQELLNKIKNKDIKASIERIVFDMNKDSFVVRHFYDAEECRIEEWEAEKIEYAKKEAEKAAKKAREEKEREMILNMYNDNMKIDLISKYSNVSIDKIQKIINKEQET